MKRVKKWLGKAIIMTTVAAASLQVGVSAEPLDDLNAIMEKQTQAEYPSPISSMLDWEAISSAMKENGAQVKLDVELPGELLEEADLPEALQGDLSLNTKTTVDMKEKKWLFQADASAAEKEVISLSLYGDENMLSLSLPQFLSRAVGLKAGSFQEQYTGSVWEEMFGDLGLPQDINLKFFPELSEDASGVTAFMTSIEDMLGEMTEVAENAMTVETREDAQYPGVTFYDVTYDTESIMNIYRTFFTQMVDIVNSTAGGVATEAADMDELMQELNTALDQGKAVLGDQFTMVYWVENDQVTKMTMAMKVDTSKLEETAADEADEEEGPTDISDMVDPEIIIMDMKYIFTDPSDIAAGFDLQMDMYEESDPSNQMHMNYSFKNETTDTTADMTVNMKLDAEGETILDADIFTMNFDADSKKMDMAVTVPDEESGQEIGMILNSTFADVQQGSGFSWNMDKLAAKIGNMEMNLLSGSFAINTVFDQIETPDTLMLGDATNDDVMNLFMELQTKAQSWAEEMGLITVQEDVE